MIISSYIGRTLAPLGSIFSKIEQHKMHQPVVTSQGSEQYMFMIISAVYRDGLGISTRLLYLEINATLIQYLIIYKVKLIITIYAQLVPAMYASCHFGFCINHFYSYDSFVLGFGRYC